ncbi:MAG: hypothetical protein AAF529_05565 [Pseudomonadota bacterium]
MSRTEFSDQIADYINGHLSPGQAHLLEAAMREDPELAEQVAFERTLQASVRAPQDGQADAVPHFAAVRAHIEAQKAQEETHGQTTAGWQFWRSWTTRAWLTPVLGGLFVVALAFNLMPGGSDFSEDFSGDYETLSDTKAQESLEIATLRIVAMPGSDLVAVTETFGLEALTWHPQTNAVDVAIPDATDLSALTATLQQDPRVRFVTVRAGSHE